MSRLKLCIYCGKSGATTVCSVMGCDRRYHYTCGGDNEVGFFYFGKYSSMCHEHRKLPKSKGSFYPSKYSHTLARNV